jgi:N-acetylmuramoyl-L-alanine amidase
MPLLVPPIPQKRAHPERWLAVIGLIWLAFLVLSSSLLAETVALDARLSGDGNNTRFIADVSRPVSYSVYVLPDPYRVIIDLRDVRFDFPPGVGHQGMGLVSAFRYGVVDEGKSRIVIDTSAPVLIGKSYLVAAQGKRPAKIVVDLVKTTEEAFGESFSKEKEAVAQDSEGSSEEVAEAVSAADNPAGDTPADEAITIEATSAPVAEQVPEAVPALAPGAGVSSPRKKEKKIVVIDPGHGGIDPGAVSPSKKTKEKDVVLAFGQALRKSLEQSGRYKVIMTRQDDRFLSLKSRVTFAREQEADLFIAIHADTLRGQTVRGATLYTLSDKASDAEAEALAQKENRADIIGGIDLEAESQEITDILIDLVQRESKNHSILFSKRAVAELKTVTQMTGKPMRSAGFVVLKAPDVPSVLIELGYLSSKEDEKLLTSPAWRLKVAKALAAAVDKYFATEVATNAAPAAPAMP